MNWDAVGAIGEVIGALGVIATLVYLSIQIRQNTKALRGSALNSVTEYRQDLLRWSADIGQAMRKAIHRPEEMTEDEKWEVSEWMTAALAARQNEFFQYKEGLLREETWETSKNILEVMFGAKCMMNWWEVYGRKGFTPEFVEYVDLVVATDQYDTGEVMTALEDVATSRMSDD